MGGARSPSQNFSITVFSALDRPRLYLLLPTLEKLENIFCTFDIPSDETRSVFPSKPLTHRHFKSTLENRTRRSTRSNRTQSRNDKENLEFLRAESRTGLEKLLTLSNSRIPRPTATATIRNRPEECMALQIWKPK